MAKIVMCYAFARHFNTTFEALCHVYKIIRELLLTSARDTPQAKPVQKGSKNTG